MFGIDTKGVYPIAPTPFTASGEIDLASTDRMVDWWGEIGATGMTVLGIMGEAPKLTADESRQYVKRVLDRVRGRIPTIVGVSARLAKTALAEMHNRSADDVEGIWHGLRPPYTALFAWLDGKATDQELDAARDAARGAAWAAAGHHVVATSGVSRESVRRAEALLPEVPLLAVLPGTGGLTRVVDKRHVRRDLDLRRNVAVTARGAERLQ